MKAAAWFRKISSGFLKSLLGACVAGVLAFVLIPLGIGEAEFSGHYPAIMVVGGLLGMVRGGLMAILYLAGRYLLIPVLLDGSPDWWQLWGTNGG